MRGHPGYENIEAMRKAGVDPKIGEWPGDEGYTPSPDAQFTARPVEHISSKPAREAEHVSPKRLSEEDLERIGRDVVAAAKGACEHGINRDLQNAVFAVNKLLAEASTYGLYADVDVIYADTIGALARGRRITIKLSKAIK